LLPPLDLTSSCVNGKAVNQVKTSDTQHKIFNQGLSGIIDEDLLLLDGINLVYPSS